MMKIKKACVWADSILKGVIYDEENKKYRLLKENAITETAKKTGIELENNAKFGLTSTKACRLLKETIKTDNKPEIALIELGGNDCDYKWSEVANSPFTNHLPNTTIEEFKMSIEEIVNTLRENNIEPILINLPPIEQDKFFEWISKGLNKNNILLWLGSKNRIYTHHETYSLAIMDIGCKMKCKVLDIREEFLKNNYEDMLCIDGMHLNNKGQSFLSKIFVDNIKKYNLI